MIRSAHILTVALAMLFGIGCDRPNTEDCEKALRNMQAILGTDTLTSQQGVQGEVRRCKAGSSKKAVACAIAAQTIDDLNKCDFEKTGKHGPLGSASGGSGASTIAPLSGGSAAPAPSGSAAPSAVPSGSAAMAPTGATGTTGSPTTNTASVPATTDAPGTGGAPGAGSAGVTAPAMGAGSAGATAPAMGAGSAGATAPATGAGSAGGTGH